MWSKRVLQITVTLTVLPEFDLYPNQQFQAAHSEILKPTCIHFGVARVIEQASKGEYCNMNIFNVKQYKQVEI